MHYNSFQSIHHFEETYHNQNDQYSAQLMLNNWSDAKGVYEIHNYNKSKYIRNNDITTY